tara:strand:- start:58498 stop:58743 length:246 start_codon:yes stop_codon:yes gene_type:complete
MRKLKFYTLDEVAEILRTHKESARQLVKSGELEGTPMGRGTKRRKWLVSEDALNAFVRHRTEAAQPGPKRKHAASTPKQWY